MKTPFQNSRTDSRRYTVKQIGRTLVLAGLLGACAPTVELRGHITDEASVNALKAGVDNRESVSDTLGTPSAIATFDTDVWFYISTRQERFAFFDPKVLERNILAIEFDGKGNMGAVRRYSAVNGRVVEIVGRETPTKGKELTFLEQMFGNFGRFSGSGTSTGPGGGGK
jgi:outer membrane protein assembly factor BamE (lipoprotein component of BamABCDE complex)